MRPLMLGHRGAGAAGHIAENTLESFELCLEQGCDGFEFDVRRSADGHAVICHDPIVGGLRTGGLRIDATPARELGVPSLNDVLKRFSQRAFLDIELKVPGLESQVLASVSEHPPRRGFVVSSFLPEVLDRIQSLDPAVPIGFIFDRQNLTPPSHLDLAWTIPQLKLVSRELVEEAHGSGEKIMVWTVNRADDIQRLIDWGVDAVISDQTKVLGQPRS